MKILAISKEVEGADWSDVTLTLEQEARRVYEMYLEGHLREICFTEDQDAVIILECESKEESTRLLGSLPLVEKGLLRFEVMELNPYTGYERILKR